MDVCSLELQIHNKGLSSCLGRFWSSPFKTAFLVILRESGAETSGQFAPPNSVACILISLLFFL